MDSQAAGFRQRFKANRFASTVVILATLSLGILIGTVVSGAVKGNQQNTSADATPLKVPSPVQLSNQFSTIARELEPTVVNINTETTLKNPHKRMMPGAPDDGQGGGGDEDSPFQDFFNRFFGGQPGAGGGQGGGQFGGSPDMRERSLGSGVIVDPKGYILTNNHVVDKADKIRVNLMGDPETVTYTATVIGTDAETDLAVIKIDAKKPLPAAKLGNSDSMQVGDWVLAIGSPFGLSQTVSAGIVSAKNRSIDEPSPNGISQSQFQRFIQTDAAINPGNSGGPLVDMAGQVIGMNTAIYTQSAGSEGIGFAMPSNILINVYNMLIGPEHKVIRGSIGIQFQAAQSSAVGRMYGFANGGVLVSSVTPNGPASKAGLQSGDVIVAVDGAPIKDGDELVSVISAKRPGSNVQLTYLRNGKRENAEVGIADRAKLFADLDNGGGEENTPDDSDVGQNKLGITVQPVSQAVAGKLGIKGGVTITSVKPGSFADNINLPQGVVITEINRKPVTDEGSYRAIVTSLKSGEDVVFVIRDPRNQGAGNSYVGGTLP
jgi:serine protease Do